MSAEKAPERPLLLVLTSTYPRWTGDPEPGFVHELSRRLTDRFRVIVVGPHAPGAPRRELLDGVEVRRYRYAPEAWQTLVNDGGIVTNLSRSKWKWLLVPSFVLCQLWAAWRVIRSERVHVIHAHWLLPQGLIATMLQFLPGQKVPLVVTSHGADLYALNGHLLESLKRFVVRRSAATTVVSDAMYQRLKAIGAEMAKVSVLSMGTDLSSVFTRRSDVQRSENEILFVGRLVEKKGLQHLIRAMPELVRERPGTHLTIVGFGPDETHLHALAVELGLEGQVRFLGALPQADLPALYRRAALFVAPFVQADSGDQEGLGLVLVEAVGCGCPVVAGDVPAVRDVFGSRRGNLVDPRDRRALVAKIRYTLEHQQEAQAEAEALRESLEGRFEWRRVADNYAELLADAASAVPAK